MTKEEYQRYLASREWAEKREMIKRRSRGTCERCLRAPHQETHHLTYERLGQENEADLLGVCSPCHRYLSAMSDHDPAHDEDGLRLHHHQTGSAELFIKYG